MTTSSNRRSSTAGNPDRATLESMRADPAAFRDNVLIEANGRLVPFGLTIEPWQRAAFTALDPALRRAAGQDAEGGPGKAWIERPRGHSKTSDIAMLCTWLLFAANRRVSVIAAAGDKDQARILRDGIDRLVRANAWLLKLLDVGRDRVANQHTGSVLEIIASDAPSSFGHLCDMIVADEICHWPAAGEELWNSLVSTAAKRPRCCLVAISNAGFMESWQWNARNRIAEGGGAGWFFESLPGPCASWITAEVLAEQRMLLPPKAYARLWDNRWATGVGDAIDEREITAALTLKGPTPGRTNEIPVIVAGVDAGWRHDHAAVVVLGGYPTKGRASLLACKSWRPSDYADGEIPLADVREEIAKLHRAYRFDCVCYDAWQLAGHAQELRGRGVPMLEVKSDPATADRIAHCLLNLFRDRTIDLYEDPALLHDLRAMTVVEKITKKLRLEGPRDDFGHCDRGFALAMALPTLLLLVNNYFEMRERASAVQEQDRIEFDDGRDQWRSCRGDNGPIYNGPVRRGHWG